jgi:hypothetical protein
VDIKAALEVIMSSMKDDIDRAIDDDEDGNAAFLGLMSAYRSLKVVVQLMASAPPPPTFPAGRFRPDGKFTTKEEPHAQQAPEILLRQDDSPRMVECVGGNSAGVVVPVPGDMPNGASTVIGGDVYTMGGGRLEFNTAQTAARNERMKGVET